MTYYYVNKNKQPNGDHEVHTDACRYLPAEASRLYLGNYDSCRPAVQAAKAIYPQSNGCYHCCYSCHTS